MSTSFMPRLFSGRRGRQTLHLVMTTEFPFQPTVKLALTVPHPIRSSIRVRVPAWASQAMPLHVNGKLAAAGQPGTYVTLDRTWKNGDTVTFMLPMDFHLTRYAGIEQEYGQERYALEYGPILLALAGPMGGRQGARLALPPEDLVKHLSPLPGQPLHFAVAGHPEHSYRPYWQVLDETFTCYPVVGLTEPTTTEPAGPGNLALARLGAKAASDSEYVQEPGGTALIIDDDFAPAGDLSHRWHSSLDTPHPHWIQVMLPKPTLIGRVVIRFADPLGHPTDFQGSVHVHGQDKIVFH